MSQRQVRGVVLASIVGGLVPTTVRAQCLEWNGLGPPGTYVRSLAVFDGGSGSPQLYATGVLPLSGGGSASLARRTGGGWSSVGGAYAGAWAMAVHDDGSGPSLFVGGASVTASGFHAAGIARWDGTSWHALGSGLAGTSSHFVFALAVFDDGTGPALYAGGDFDSAGGIAASNIAKWNGSSWSALGKGTDNNVFALKVFDDGSGAALYAAGYFATAGGVLVKYIARWDGAAWSALGTGTHAFVYSLATHDDGTGPALYAGGKFTHASGQPVYRVARWDGAAWSGTDGYGVNDTVWSLTSFDDGTGPALFAGGEFTMAGGSALNNAANHIAKWDGSAWSPVGAGTNGVVYALTTFDDGLGRGPDLYVGGQFTTTGGAHGYGLARWVGCGGPGTLYCSGDGAASACPCGNTGADGRGCENSAATGGALLVSAGSTSADSVVLRASGMGPSTAAVFLQGDATAPPQAFGDGLRCASGQLKRLYVESATGGTAIAPGFGEPTITQQSAGLGDPIAPGSMRHYQTCYRDAVATFCPAPQGSTWNVSNAVSIPW